LGRSTPCGHHPSARSVQTCISTTSPRTPERITSIPARERSPAIPCVPIWVASFISAAVFAMTRASSMLQVKGFSQ